MAYQIIYSSESTTPMQTDDLEDLLEHAQGSNATKGITGALVYAEGFFLQILEGDRVTLEDLMAKISRDPRHEAVTVLRRGETPFAIFGDWKMGYISATPEQVAKWAGFSSTTAIPEVLAGISQDPNQAAQVAQSILSFLATEEATRTNAE